MAASPLRDDRVTDWLDELLDVAATAGRFSPAARSSVVAVIDSFAAEDGLLPRSAVQARNVLVQETLLRALTVSVQRSPSRRPASSAA